LEIFTVDGPSRQDFTALAPHDYTAPAPHDCAALAPPPRARYANNSEFKFQVGVPGQNPKIANSSCPSTGLSKTLYVHPLLARIEPSFGFTTRTQRPLRQFLKARHHKSLQILLLTKSNHCFRKRRRSSCKTSTSNSIPARMIQSYVATPSSYSSSPSLHLNPLNARHISAPRLFPFSFDTFVIYHLGDDLVNCYLRQLSRPLLSPILLPDHF
jgi:hypothetical protein